MNVRGGPVVMFKILLACFLVLPVAAPSSSADTTPPYRNYASFTHSLELVSFRAGNHDPQGKLTHYYFQVKLVALLDQDDEKKIAGSDKKSKQAEVGKFGAIALHPLSSLAIAAKNNDASLEIDGDRIRILVSEMMSAFGVPEEQVAVQGEVSLFREQKKYFVLPDDQLIGTFTYEPLPFRSQQQSLHENQQLTFEDKVGTHIIMAVVYQKPTS